MVRSIEALIRLLSCGVYSWPGARVHARPRPPLPDNLDFGQAGVGVLLSLVFLYLSAVTGLASLRLFPLRIAEAKLRPIPSKGWAEMIRKVYEVDLLVCPQCGATMKIISFLTDYAVVDRIIDHLKLSFVA